MDQTVVTASVGRSLGTRPSRRMRAEGRLPAVVYGLGRDPIPVSVDYAQLRDALKTESGLNTVLELDLDGESSETVIVRSVQRDPIRRVVTHADFLRVDPTVAIKVKVPINLIGEAVEVHSEGGIVEQNMFEIEVEVSPMSIPDSIDVDVSELTLDQRISVGDLALPEGVLIEVAEDVAVVTPVVPRVVELEPEVEEGEELEEGEEGVAEAEEGAEGEPTEASDDGGDE